MRPVPPPAPRPPVTAATQGSRLKPPLPRLRQDLGLVWHPPGEKTMVHGLDLYAGFYDQDVPRWDGHPFAVNVQLPVDWQLPPYAPTEPDYRSMSPSHRGFYLFWLKFQDASTVPDHSRLVYVETWLQGVEWRLLIEGQYDPQLIRELERVLVVNQPCLTGTDAEERILNLLCFSTYCYEREAFSELWRRLAATGLFAFTSLSRQLILADLFERGEPLTADLAALVANVYRPEWAEEFDLFRDRFTERHPTGRPLDDPGRIDRDVRYHSEYTVFESRAERTCPKLELPNFEHEIGGLDFDACRCSFELQALREATAKAARDAEFQARFKTRTSISPVASAEPKSLVNPQRLETIAAETRAVREMLAPILALPDEEATTGPAVGKASPNDPVPEWAAGLKLCFVTALIELQARAEWSKTEFDQVCRKHQLTPRALHDAVNAWSDEKHGDFLFEGDDPIRVQQHLLHRKP